MSLSESNKNDSSSTPTYTLREKKSIIFLVKWLVTLAKPVVRLELYNRFFNMDILIIICGNTHRDSRGRRAFIFCALNNKILSSRSGRGR